MMRELKKSSPALLPMVQSIDMPGEIRILVFTLTLWLSGILSWAQVVEIPLDHSKLNSTNLRTGQVQVKDTLELPFWDDFSTSLLIPDSSRWIVGENVNVNKGRGLNAPSMNVATFDGTDRSGIPYADTDANGPADSLISQPINLDNIPVNLRNTL